MSPLNFNLMAETTSSQEDSTGKGEVSSKGGEGERGKTGGNSGESSWSESEGTSEPEAGTLEIMEASSSRFMSFSPPSSTKGGGISVEAKGA